MQIKDHKIFTGVYTIFYPDGMKRIATKNLSQGIRVYGEDLINIDDDEYRVWDPKRSKLAAAIVKGIQVVPIKPGIKVLYLGAASGTTPSHISDIVGHDGLVFCIEFSARSIRDLVLLCEKRANMIPILDDARYPRNYENIVDQVDVVYCDVAQPDQAKIIAENAKLFVKRGGHLLLAIKSRSISATKPPSVVYKQQMNILEEEGFINLEAVDLHPLEKDHAIILAKAP